MSHPTTFGLTNAASDRRRLADQGRWLAVPVLAWLTLAAAILVWRRLAGALAEPLPAPTLAMLGLALAATAFGVRRLGSIRAEDGPARRRELLLAGLATAIAFVIAAAISVPGTSTFGLAILWSVLVVEESADWFRTLRRRRGVQDGDRSTATTVPGILLIGPEAPDGDPPALAGTALATDVLPGTPGATGVLPVPHDPEASVVERSGTLALDQPPTDGVTQQFVRSHTADGTETLCGWLRVEMPAGARTISSHIAFCPPFARTPGVEIHQITGPTARVKPAQVLPYGARLEVKLDHPNPEPATILLRFLATLSET
jgi:hypothetical protein